MEFIPYRALLSRKTCCHSSWRRSRIEAMCRFSAEALVRASLRRNAKTLLLTFFGFRRCCHELEEHHLTSHASQHSRSRSAVQVRVGFVERILGTLPVMGDNFVESIRLSGMVQAEYFQHVQSKMRLHKNLQYFSINTLNA